MQDPYVSALHYRLEHSDTVDYEKAKPLDHETDEFKVRLDEGEAVFEMKKHPYYGCQADSCHFAR